MENFKKYFGITTEKEDFIDIPLTKDVELYVDPTRILGVESEKFDSKTAKKKLDDYFLTVFTLYRKGEKQRAVSMVSSSGEINATHLGLSKGKSQGTGVSPEILNRVFSQIVESGALTDELLYQPMLIPMFVPNFGPDRFSDLVVSILSKELAEFTIKVCEEYGVPLSEESIALCKYYDIYSKKWIELKSCLPCGPDGKPILLIPREIAVSEYNFSAVKYVNEVILVYRQNYHLENNTNLVKLENKKGDLVAVAPSKETLRQVEIREVHQDNYGMLKSYALVESLKAPWLLTQYMNKLNKQGLLKSTNALTEEKLKNLLYK